MLKSKAAWLAAGLIAGFVIGLNVAGLWPQVPVHAVATHGQENFAICTGPVDTDIEAIYFLDFLTGDLRAAVLGTNTRKFTAFYTYNVSKDVVPAGAKNPKYLLVTGVADLRRGANAYPLGQSVVYVAEMTSGQVAAYALPWNPAQVAQGIAQRGTFVPLDKMKFRTAAIRE